MITPTENQRPAYRPTQAGHYVVAAAIILAAVLLILFMPRANACCCQRQATPATPASITTLGEASIIIPPGHAAPRPAVVHRVAVAPATMPVLPLAAVALPADPVYGTPVAMMVAEPMLATFAPLPDLLTPVSLAPNPGAPSVHVDAAGSSLLWMTLGVTAIVGALLLRRGR
jgi:hypothetical protein